ncbi:hypothetical protein GCM10011371_09780 [Novosphingobium marinum]|uniref:Heme-degrading monooxygenase HmoA n=1 Tax=Novosphingobium marinum TaxID=1514948 RepID=A0A7Y9XUZ7_9SPHN|nr:antibiotic biosynthesis monooxygenase [Novosphingobium marinum]NYH95084.1 heme-degrading monooxygenase HmoA [Novosphingobium marinum]GGC24141.1 hypothetical protein GCM10011371_09780 [Novosphingobium marinum]
MYLVVFRNRKRRDIDRAAYDAEAAEMEQLSARQPGYLSFKSYVADDGEVVALSEWDTREAARQWGRHAEHAATKRRGVLQYYQSYTLFGCEDPVVHRFNRDD